MSIGIPSNQEFGDYQVAVRKALGTDEEAGDRPKTEDDDMLHRAIDLIRDALRLAETGEYDPSKIRTRLSAAMTLLPGRF